MVFIYVDAAPLCGMHYHLFVDYNGYYLVLSKATRQVRQRGTVSEELLQRGHQFPFPIVQPSTTPHRYQRNIGLYSMRTPLTLRHLLTLHGEAVVGYAF